MHIFLIIVFLFSFGYSEVVVPKNDKIVVQRFNDNPKLFESIKNISYGQAENQKYDLYIPNTYKTNDKKIPIVILVHGGAWEYGDKLSEQFLKYKLYYFILQDIAVMSINYRTFPKYSIQDEIDDLVLSIKHSIVNTDEKYKVDFNKIILLGHMSGAHLVSMVASNYEYYDLPIIKLAYIIENPVFNLVEILNDKTHNKLYEERFQNLSAKRMSPYFNITKNDTNYILVCSTRNTYCKQTKDFANKLNSIGNNYELYEENLTSRMLNIVYGQKGEYTERMWNTLQKYIFNN